MEGAALRQGLLLPSRRCVAGGTVWCVAWERGTCGAVARGWGETVLAGLGQGEAGCCADVYVGRQQWVNEDGDREIERSLPPGFGLVLAYHNR